MSKTSKPRKALEFQPKRGSDAEFDKAQLILEYEFEKGIDFHRRVIKLTGEIDEASFNKIDSALTEMESMAKKDITIKINSMGGSVYDALAIVSRIRESKCGIITKGYGCVMSCATLILASGTRRREMSEIATFMHHEASYDVGGRHSTNKATVVQIEKEEALWASLMEKFSNKSAHFWKTKGVGTDAYFTAQELLEMGVVDELF